MPGDGSVQFEWTVALLSTNRPCRQFLRRPAGTGTLSGDITGAVRVGEVRVDELPGGGQGTVPRRED